VSGNGSVSFSRNLSRHLCRNLSHNDTRSLFHYLCRCESYCRTNPLAFPGCKRLSDRCARHASVLLPLDLPLPHLVCFTANCKPVARGAAAPRLLRLPSCPARAGIVVVIGRPSGIGWTDVTAGDAG